MVIFSRNQEEDMKVKTIALATTLSLTSTFALAQAGVGSRRCA
jgi:hypothetical protein